MVAVVEETEILTDSLLEGWLKRSRRVSKRSPGNGDYGVTILGAEFTKTPTGVRVGGVVQLGAGQQWGEGGGLTCCDWSTVL